MMTGDDWGIDMANGLTNGTNLARGLSLVQAIWGVILIAVIIASAVGTEHLRIERAEWEIASIRSEARKENEESDAWRTRVDVLLQEIRDRLTRMERHTTP